MRLFARASLAVAVAAPLVAAACGQPAPPAKLEDGNDSGVPVVDAAANPGIIIPDGGSTSPEGGVVRCLAEPIGTRPLPGYLEVVVDGSAAMDGAKWAAVSSAVKQVAAAWQAENNATFGAGLSLFSDSLDGSKGLGPYPTAADVPLRVVDAAQVANFGARVAGTPALGAVSLAALRGNYSTIDGLDVAAAGLPTGGDKIVVFVTGAPPADDTAGTASEAATLAKTYRAKGITTFAVLLADGATTPALRAFVGGIAANGGGFAHKTCDAAASDAANACHFEVDTTAAPATAAQQLTAALQQARASDPCTRVIDDPLGQHPGLRPTDVEAVSITNSAGSRKFVPSDAVDGWTLDATKNAQRIQLHGVSCTAFKSAQGATVDVFEPCPVLVP